MRDPDRIPMILGAVERRWREVPDLRLGQLLGNLARERNLLLVEDGELLQLLGPETDEEHSYVRAEPAARKKGWRRWFRASHWRKR